MMRLLSGTLMVAGAAIVALAANSAFQPAEAPYEFRMSHASPDALPDLKPPGVELAQLERLEWKTPGARTAVATAIVMRDADGRLVPLDWQNAVTEPVFFSDMCAAETSKVLTAIREHVPSDAVVLSWWDLSRRIRSVAQRQAPLDDPLARGLLTPAAWSSGDFASDRQRTLWGAGVPVGDGDVFAKFIDALLLDEERGAAVLTEISGGKTAYVAVHLSDISKAAAVRPDIVSIAYRDFPSAGHSHSVMKTVRQWMQEEKIEGAYAVEPMGNALRLHYLLRKSNSDLLLTRLLPFSTSNPLRLDHLQLVYQHKGYWIYKLGPAKA
ncbi:MAG: hydroxylamine oxidation protein HaoB [Methylocystaceae bacterium]|nr:MAG: hydroxylamine oxidation protein HaoB [Methylocystaceae bacterium]